MYDELMPDVNHRFYPGLLAMLCFLFLACRLPAVAQNNNGYPARVNQNRLKTVMIAESAIATIGLTGLNYLWYRKFPHSRFHLFNDSNEWMNMDKAGHATTAYSISSVQYDMMRWSGVPDRQAVWIGGLTAMAFQTIIEIFDGFSSKWGFSVTDMLANIAGTSLFMSQQLAFNGQRVQLKFSFHHSIFASYNPAELGRNRWQTWLKDYNGQTYWLSVNPASFMGANNSFPRWLNASFGYGAEGMTGGLRNPEVIQGVHLPAFRRYRQYYISLDANFRGLEKSNTRPDLLLSLPAIIKLPFPAVEVSSPDLFKFHGLYF